MPTSKQLRTVQLNAENLFLFFDEPLKKSVDQYSEKEWQKISSATQANKPLHKTMALAASLREIDADIILLNEVGGIESLKNFAHYFLADHYVAYLIEGNSNRGIDCGYLVKKTVPFKCVLKSHKDRPLHFLYPHEKELNEYLRKNRPEKIIKTHYFSRDCLELRLLDPTSNEPQFIFLLVHLKSKLDPEGIDPSGRERRAAELKTLVEIYREIEIETNGRVPICIAGDLNGTARKKDHEPEFKPIYELTNLRDVFDILELPDEARATQVQISRGGRVDLMQIDSIFVSPNLATCLVREGCYVFRYRNELRLPSPFPKSIEERTLLPSDHYPVVATFTVTSPVLL